MIETEVVDAVNINLMPPPKNIKKKVVSILLMILILFCAFILVISVLRLQSQHNKLVIEYNKLYRECKTIYPIYNESIGDLNQNKPFGLEESEN